MKFPFTLYKYETKQDIELRKYESKVLYSELDVEQNDLKGWFIDFNGTKFVENKKTTKNENNKENTAK